MYQIHNAAVTITVNEFPPALNGSGGLIRMHYGTYMKVRDRWIHLVWEALTPKLQEIFTTHHFVECDLHFTRRSLHRDGMDWDNCCASLKVPADALVHRGILLDDNPSVIRNFYPTQVRVRKRTDQGIEIQLVGVLAPKNPCPTE